MFETQRASILKRASAFLLDIIILSIVATLFCFVLSVVTSYDSYYKEYKGYSEQYEQEYGVSFNINSEEFKKLDEAQQKAYTEARTAFINDVNVKKCFGTIVNLTLIILSVGVLLATLITEFVVPLIFKNGQTVGKKIFSIAVIRSDSVRVSSIAMFIRTLFGKCIIEIMIPLYVVIMLMFGQADIFTVLLLFALIIAQIVAFIASKTNSFLHDLIAGTVVVDMSTQMIFESEQAMIDYKNELHQRQVEKASY